jgi:hypothetical protein
MKAFCHDMASDRIACGQADEDECPDAQRVAPTARTCQATKRCGQDTQEETPSDIDPIKEQSLDA